MENINRIAAFVVVAAALTGFIRMWYCMRKEGVRPNMLTWLTWAILAFALLKSEWDAIGQTWVLSLLINDLVCIVVTAIALVFIWGKAVARTLADDHEPNKFYRFLRSRWRARKNDMRTFVEVGCLLMIVVASIVWWATSSALIALICYLVIDVVAVFPTLHNVLRDYKSEDGWEWVCFQIANTAVIFTVDEFTAKQLAYPFVASGIAAAVNISRFISWRKQRRHPFKAV